jgi:phosphopantothenoylcysteine decarboxylase / phosphopantothenate---cysteine ligase
MLQGKKIIVAVTGSISAYKSLFLVRLLVKQGAEVRVVMSKGALQFIQPLSFATLSKHPIVSDFISSEEEGTWNNHVDLALWANAILVVPTTANTLAKFVSGTCDNVLLAVLMSSRCPIFFAPAMDHDMMLHEGTRENLKILKERGCYVFDSGFGELASGLIGEGRLAEPEVIIDELIAFFNPNQLLKGKKILINAGPTFEAIDPVRYIGNRSSGKMGVALANACLSLGAKVTLVMGPSHISLPETARIFRVESAEEMAEVCLHEFASSDWAILSAAVADYKVAESSSEKLKKSDAEIILKLQPTLDIAKELGKRKNQNQRLVCFALETENEEQHAKQKLERKNADAIILNSLRSEGVAFGSDTNQVQIIFRNGNEKKLPLMQKSEVAQHIISELIQNGL